MADNNGEWENVFQGEQVETPTARSNLELGHLRRILNSTVFPGGLIGSSPAITAIHQLIEKTVDRNFKCSFPAKPELAKNSSPAAYTHRERERIPRLSPWILLKETAGR